MKDTFKDIYKKITRPGADALLQYLEESSFFQDPASTAYHLSREGGLCEHSVNVYARLAFLCRSEAQYNPNFAMPSEESIAICGLLHDLCKVGVYKTEWKNKKTYDREKVEEAYASGNGWSVKHDQAGDFIWETVPSYKFEDPFPYGHGEKSVYIIQKYITLTDDEAFAIRFHMGSWNDGEKQNAGKAFSTFPLSFLLHCADEYVTFLDEK